MTPLAATLLDSEGLQAAIEQMAIRILEASGDGSLLRLVGIERGGPPVARRLAAAIERRTGRRPPIGSLDIALYRDDLAAHPVPRVGPTDLPFDVQGADVVLCDDVLHTGRTVRAALDELTDFGRPRRVFLAVVVVREGRELPIQPDFVALAAACGDDETIEVRFAERDAVDEVVRVARRA